MHGPKSEEPSPEAVVSASPAYSVDLPELPIQSVLRRRRCTTTLLCQQRSLRAEVIEMSNLEKRIQVGPCSATIFVRDVQTETGNVRMRDIVLQRAYKDKEGNYQHTNSYRVNDLPQGNPGTAESVRAFGVPRSTQNEGEPLKSGASLALTMVRSVGGIVQDIQIEILKRRTVSHDVIQRVYLHYSM